MAKKQKRKPKVKRPAKRAGKARRRPTRRHLRATGDDRGAKKVEAVKLDRAGTTRPEVVSDVDVAVRFIMAGNQKEEVFRELTERGSSPEEAKRVVAEASLKLKLAARWDATEQTGLMLIRVNELYMAAWAKGDVVAALAVQKELNKVLALAQKAQSSEDVGAQANAQAELDAVDGYLRPLFPGDQSPTSELARLAVAKLTAPGKTGAAP